MIANLDPYAARSESCIAWIGDIPAHWKTRRAKWLFTKMNRPVRRSDEVVTCFRDGVVTLRKNRRLTGFTESLKEIGYQGVRRGDLVIHGMDAFAGAIGVSDSDGKSTPVYSVCSPSVGVNSNYYAYLVREMARTQWIQSLARGVRERSTDFRFEGFAAQSLPLPPPEEQAAIVRYLDHVDRRISRYIRTKQRLIALLEEQKQAIIHRAVTRGLDPDVRLKPSGVEWLGDIPEHWEVRPLKSLAAIRSGIALGKQYGNQNLVEVPYLRVANVQSGGLDLSEVKTIQVPGAEASRSLLQVGDVLMTEGGDADKLGRGTIWTGEIAPCVHQNHVFAVRVAEHPLRNGYLELLLGSPYGRAYFIRTSKQTTNLASTNRTTIGSFPIPLPSPVEQGRVIESIARETAPSRAAVADAAREIDLLREYRTRLISDVVTGKLDVREAAVSLPDVDPADLEDILAVGDAGEDELEPELEEIAT